MGRGADLVIRIATKGAELASKNMKDVGDSTSKTNKPLSKFSNIAKAGVAVGLMAIARGAQESIQAFAQFEDKLNQSLAIMNTTTQQQEAMSKAAREVGMTTRISAEDSAEAFFFLASAGLDAEQSISALPQVAAFAQAGMFDMATATDLATDAQSALGLTVNDANKNLENLTRVTDVLVKANTLANASVQQFSEALTTKAGAALKVVNKDIEEGVAVLAVFADRGVKGAEAGDKLNQVLRDIPRATAKNTAEFKALGLEMFDSQGNMKNVADIIENLDAVLGPMSDEMKAATLDQLGLNRGVADAVKILSGSTDQIRRYEEALRDSGGTTQEVADKQMQSLQAQTEIMQAKFSELALILGEKLAPMLESTIGGISRLLDIIIEGVGGNDEYTDATKAMADALGIEESQVMSTNNALNEKLLLDQKHARASKEKAKQTEDYYEALYFQSLIEKDLITNAHELDRETGNLNQTKEETIALTEEEIEAEQKLAQEREEKSLGALQKVLSAYKKLQAIQDKIADLQDNEKKKLEKLNDAIEDKTEAEKGLTTAQQELARQQEISKQVTLEEELAILRANEALADAKDKLDGTRKAEIEYELAKQKLNEAIVSSTSATRAEEQALADVERAKDKVKKETEAVKKAQQEYQKAQEDLAKATEKNIENMLEMAIAKKELDKAIADAEALGAFEEGIMQMVDLVGGSFEEIAKQFQNIFMLGNQTITMDDIVTGAEKGKGSAVTKYPSTGGSPQPISENLERMPNNIITVNTGAILGTPQEVEVAVAKAIQEGAKRGINIAF